MSEKQAFVKNGADEAQVKDGARRERKKRDRELMDLEAILATHEGRRFVWRLLTYCRVFGSIWEPSAKIHYSSGQQDVGHFVMAEVVAAKEDALLQMMKEAKAQGEFNDV